MIDFQKEYEKLQSDVHESLTDALEEAVDSAGLEQSACDEVYGLWRFMSAFVRRQNKEVTE